MAHIINSRNRSVETAEFIYEIDSDGNIVDFTSGSFGGLHFNTELHKVVGGTFNFRVDLQPLLAELVTGSGRTTTDPLDQVGIEGVELVSLDGDSMTVSIRGWDGTKDTVIFQGSGVEAIIEDVAGSRIDVKGWNSEFAVFDYQNENSMNLGGTWGELKNVVGHNISVGGRDGNEVVELFQELVTGSGRTTKDASKIAGINGVELLSLTDDGYTIKIDGWDNGINAMSDTITFSNLDADFFAEAGFKNRIDVKGWNSEFAIFDYESTKSMNLGGTWGELRELVGHSIKTTGRDGDEVAEILDELINGDGIKGVKLLGLDEDSFSIQINGWGFDQRSEDRGWNKMVDTILFTNVEDVIDEVLTSPALTSDDGYNIA
ncbi:hypothetical protein PUV47_08755 [Pseudovibrio exalbescens]|uniref:hypothetical protein n=1 Tax=Pseudovibrio exalbescens TaxID=197461 RepID=UPI0023662D93|nr:hypothetical protein [Pseudovibrio exalbescens]MDD7910006.1 hypothetical protein [Pseudovibrio exalbescens]